jgi:hypothetical protein
MHAYRRTSMRNIHSTRRRENIKMFLRDTMSLSLVEFYENDPGTESDGGGPLLFLLWERNEQHTMTTKNVPLDSY